MDTRANANINAMEGTLVRNTFESELIGFIRDGKRSAKGNGRAGMSLSVAGFISSIGLGIEATVTHMDAYATGMIYGLSSSLFLNAVFALPHSISQFKEVRRLHNIIEKIDPDGENPEKAGLLKRIFRHGQA